MKCRETVQAFLECSSLPLNDYKERGKFGNKCGNKDSSRGIEKESSQDLVTGEESIEFEAQALLNTLIATAEAGDLSVPKPICLSSYDVHAKRQGINDGLGGLSSAHQKPYDFLGAASIVFALRPVKSTQAVENDSEKKDDQQHQYLDWFCWLAEKKSWLTVGFSDSRLRYRSAQSNIQHELLLRALRGRSKPQEQWSVFDATAGLARDAWLMAAAGYRVDAVERVGVLSTMLGQSLAWNPQSDIAEKLSISTGDSLQMMAESADSKYDIVYLDPMYESGLKSTAAVKNEMFFLRQLSHWFKAEQDGAVHTPETRCGSTDQPLRLLELARCVAKRKVVVKRAPKAPFLAEVEPASSLTAKAVRFDIYPC